MTTPNRSIIRTMHNKLGPSSSRHPGSASVLESVLKDRVIIDFHCMLSCAILNANSIIKWFDIYITNLCDSKMLLLAFCFFIETVKIWTPEKFAVVSLKQFKLEYVQKMRAYLSKN